MIPYGKHSLGEDDLEAVREALTSDYITQGPRIESFETKLSEKFGCDHAVAVNNGTMALLLAYQSLGLTDGDEFITTPNTFAATANAGLFLGAKPIFQDIDPESYTLSTDRVANHLRNNDTSSLAGITTVHFAGYPAELERLSQLAEEHDLFLLEDACHAPGAEWTDSDGISHTIGSCDYSDAAVLSFHPVKHITTGEGGAILTNDDEIAGKARQYRSHGITKTPEDFHGDTSKPWYYEMQHLGLNARITDFQCALGESQLDKLDTFVNKRRTIAERYHEAFGKIEPVNHQKINDNKKNSYHLFVIRVPQRDALFEKLQDHDISPQVHYIPVYNHPYYKKKFEFKKTDYPEAEQYYREAISLPVYPDLSSRQQAKVIDCIRDFYD
jgi:UDP-4-amino-4,6-dideoxy-N-acetyl-beta-L-altrosamine transaminase